MSMRKQTKDAIWLLRAGFGLWLVLTALGYCIEAAFVPVYALIAELHFYEALGWTGAAWPVPIWSAGNGWTKLAALGPAMAATVAAWVVPWWFWLAAPIGAACLVVAPLLCLRRWRKARRRAELAADALDIRGGEETTAHKLSRQLEQYK